MLKAVFFDVDFTLIYPGPTFRGEGYQQFCARHGMSVEPSRFDQAVLDASFLLDEAQDHIYDPEIFIRYTRYIIERMGGAGPEVDACAREIYQEWAACQHFSLYEDVAPTLNVLAERELRLGLISNTHRSLTSFQSHFELERLISAAISSSEHGFMKPHPSIFEAGLKLLDVAPSEAMMVGDSFKQDIEGARRIGMHAVLVNRSSALDPRSEIDGVPVIQSLTELLKVLGF
ncbi:MAG TPA: HAD-IA family hydrolase [Vicinamibacterales bacterium]